MRDSGIPIHPAYNGSALVRISTNTSNNYSAAGTQSQPSNNDIILDPNNDFDDDERVMSVQYIIGFLYVTSTQFHMWCCSICGAPRRHPREDVARAVPPARDAMRASNRERLKSLLRYSQHKPE